MLLGCAPKNIARSSYESLHTRLHRERRSFTQRFEPVDGPGDTAGGYLSAHSHAAAAAETQTEGQAARSCRGCGL
jgi:hypothetical protein